MIKQFLPGVLHCTVLPKSWERGVEAHWDGGSLDLPYLQDVTGLQSQGSHTNAKHRVKFEFMINNELFSLCPQYFMGHICTVKSHVYKKFKFNWASCMLLEILKAGRDTPGTVFVPKNPLALPGTSGSGRPHQGLVE